MRSTPLPFPDLPLRQSKYERQQEWREPKPQTRRRQQFVERETIHLARYCEEGVCKYRAYLNTDIMRRDIGRWLQETYNRWRPTLDENNFDEVAAATAMYTHLTSAAERGTSLHPVVDAFNQWCEAVQKPIHLTIMAHVPLMEEVGTGVGIGRSIFIAEASEDYELTDDPEAYNTRRGAQLALLDSMEGWLKSLESDIQLCDNQGAASAFRNLAVAIGNDRWDQAIGSWGAIIKRCEDIDDEYTVQLYEAELKG